MCLFSLLLTGFDTSGLSPDFTIMVDYSMRFPARWTQLSLSCLFSEGFVIVVVGSCSGSGGFFCFLFLITATEMEQNYNITLLVDFVLPVNWSPEFLKDRNSRLKPLSFGSFFSQSNKVLFDWNYLYHIISSVSTYSAFIYFFIAKNRERVFLNWKKKSEHDFEDWRIKGRGSDFIYMSFFSQNILCGFCSETQLFNLSYTICLLGLKTHACYSSKLTGRWNVQCHTVWLSGTVPKRRSRSVMFERGE